jgi:hypothetical protein
MLDVELSRCSPVSKWRQPVARRRVAFGVVVQLAIGNLLVVWRATVIGCIAIAES